jgi:uncharacterized membrane protein
MTVSVLQNIGRLPHVDLLRGIVMLLMVVDHAREYAAGPGGLGDPMDLDRVTPLLFTMRWLAHFCAPWFALLMGMSAWLSFRNRPSEEAWKHLVLRGAILLLLEFTIIDWSWTFYPPWPRKFFQVIAALGCAMIALGLLCRLGRRAVGLTGAAILALHNLFDGVRFAPDTPWHYVWSVLHQMNVLPLPGGFEVRTTYPIFPIIGIACVGFWMGAWLVEMNTQRVRERFWRLGIGAIALFVVLRLTGYGDASPFAPQESGLYTAFALGNVTKYPISLQFALMTLGPLFLLLGRLHGRFGQGQRRGVQIWSAVRLLGQVPLFFYVGHLYLLHALALVWALASGYPLAAFRFAERFGGIPEGFGFPLWVTLPFAGITVLLLLPACQRFAQLRHSKRHRWLSYL